MVRLTERFIFFPMSREALELDWTVERVRTRSVDRTFSSAAIFAIWAFFSSLRDENQNYFSSTKVQFQTTTSDRSIISKTLLKLAWNLPLEMEEYIILLQKCVLELLSVELYTQLISTHPGSSQKNRMSDEVRGWGSPCRVRMDHKLSGRYMHILIKLSRHQSMQFWQKLKALRDKLMRFILFRIDL